MQITQYHRNSDIREFMMGWACSLEGDQNFDRETFFKCNYERCYEKRILPFTPWPCSVDPFTE